MSDVMVNERAWDMFSIMVTAYDFSGSRIIDIGCGYGDILAYAARNGASYLVGIDFDEACLRLTGNKLNGAVSDGYSINYRLEREDINDWIMWAWMDGEHFDVAICTSVIPYLRDKYSALLLMSMIADHSIIEMQYYGDGPGPEFIKNDVDMEKWLLDVWSRVRKIGQTYTGRDPAYRSIWMCSEGRFTGDKAKSR